MKSNKLICICCCADSAIKRFDLLTMPSGGLAAVGGTAKKLNIDMISIDEMFVGNDKTFCDVLYNEIDESLKNYKNVFVFAELFLYNSTKSMKTIEKLRKDYGTHIKIGVAGQLVNYCYNAYDKNPMIDIIGVGNAESILYEMIYSGKRLIMESSEDAKKSILSRVFDYSNYYAIEERLDETEANSVIGSGINRIDNVRQLVIEGNKGCPWAARKNGGCSFCSIEGNKQYINMNIDDYLNQISVMVRDYRVNWIYDPSSQWLPWREEDRVRYLNQLLDRSRILGAEKCSKYIYLSPFLVNDTIASLLKEADVDCVYLGIDHFYSKSIKTLNKPVFSMEILEKCMDSLKKYNITVRIGIVIGAYETEESIQAVIDGLTWMMKNYGEILLTVGCFPISVFLGSRFYNDYKVSSFITPEAKSIIDKIDTNGYISWEEQLELDRNFIDATCSFSSDELFALQKKIMTLTESNNIISYYSKGVSR